MKKSGKILFGAVAATMLCGTILFTGSNTSQAAGEYYDTAKEEIYGETFRSVYENRLAGSPLEAEGADGNVSGGDVDTATGHLLLSRNDLSLDGTGGMDFELNRYYDSNEANLGHATVEYQSEIKVDTVWVHFKTADGSDHKIIVSTAVLNNHKKALKDLLVTYTEGGPRKEDKVEKDTQRTKIVSNQGHNVYGLASG